MLAAIKPKLSSKSGGDEMKGGKAGKYRLRVTAGPSYDHSSHNDVLVNTDNATYIENEFLRAKIKVRIRDYCGLPSSCPEHSIYFDNPSHAKDQYSIAFSFVPKKDLSSADTVWGNDFDHPVRDRLPPGFNTAFKIVKNFIDPGIQCDAYADEPWLYGPSLSSWLTFRIGKKVSAGEDFPAPVEEHAMEEGAGSKEASQIRQRLGLPHNSERRRKHFLDARNRENFVFEKERLYQADFFNPYIDFRKFALKLPGFSLGVIGYIDEKTHDLRHVFKNRKTGDLYFNINITLLFGDQLQEASKKDQEHVNSADKKPNESEGSKDAAQNYQEPSRDPKAYDEASHDDGVNEITQLLQDTATDSKTKIKTGVLE